MIKWILTENEKKEIITMMNNETNVLTEKHEINALYNFSHTFLPNIIFLMKHRYWASETKKLCDDARSRQAHKHISFQEKEKIFIIQAFNLCYDLKYCLTNAMLNVYINEILNYPII